MTVLISNYQRSKKLNTRKIKRELNSALRLLGLKKAELSVLFVGDARMKGLNTRYRGIPKATDVLSFPQDVLPDDSGYAVLGDIVVCVPQIVRQSREWGTTFSSELRRILVHGLLHLVGYDHEAGSSQAAAMKRKERLLLNALAKVA